MIDSIIIQALEDFGVPIQPNGYEGTDLEYISYVYSELGALYADGAPHAIRYILDVHWYLQTGKDPGTGKAAICHLLRGAGATWPNIVNASDAEGQHYVFECEMKSAVPAMPELEEPGGDSNGGQG